MDTTKTSYEEALSIDKLKSVHAAIDTLPNEQRYKTHIEEKLRSVLLGEESDHKGTKYVAFSELPDKTQNLIGYTRTETGTENLPWWLREFEWSFELDTTEHITVEQLPRLEESNPSETQVNLPTLESSDLMMALEAFDDVSEYFEGRLDIENTEPYINLERLELPENPFVLDRVGEGTEMFDTLRVTEEFEEFFEAVLKLCPPINPTLQALNVVVTGLDPEYNQLLPVGVEQTLKQAGLDTGRDQDLFDNITKLYQISSEFDIEIEVEDQKDGLNALEQLRYQSWKDNIPRTEAVDEVIQAAFQRMGRVPTDKDTVAKALFLLPFYLNSRGSVTLDSTKRPTHNHYSTEDEPRIRAIADILPLEEIEFNGW